MDNSVITAGPLSAPTWRKVLALRVLAVSALSLVSAFYLVDLLDSAKLDLPRWLEIVLVLPAVAAFFAFIANLAAGMTDLVVHFVPAGRIRKTLLQGDRTPEQIAKEFGETGYVYALSPFFIVAGLFVLAIACVLVLGGLSALGSMWGAVSGWPSWAIVIAVLLVLLLLKK